MFNPQLPQIKRNAIDGHILGTVNKIFLEFSEPFWDESFNAVNQLWLNEDLDEVRKSKYNWIEDITGFYVVHSQPNILCGWLFGAKARQMEHSSDEDVIEACIFLLNKFLKRTDVPQPIAMKRSSWNKNPNFRGSYSFQPIRGEELNVTNADLATPLKSESGQLLVQFAGEATHDHYYSTVHGALETGWREAQRIIDLYKE